MQNEGAVIKDLITAQKKGIVEEAKSWIGNADYEWGAKEALVHDEGKRPKVDCSGVVTALFKNAGIDLNGDSQDCRH